MLELAAKAQMSIGLIWSLRSLLLRFPQKNTFIFAKEGNKILYRREGSITASQWGRGINHMSNGKSSDAIIFSSITTISSLWNSIVQCVHIGIYTGKLEMIDMTFLMLQSFHPGWNDPITIQIANKKISMQKKSRLPLKGGNHTGKLRLGFFGVA